MSRCSAAKFVFTGALKNKTKKLCSLTQQHGRGLIGRWTEGDSATDLELTWLKTTVSESHKQADIQGSKTSFVFVLHGVIVVNKITNKFTKISY